MNNCECLVLNDECMIYTFKIKLTSLFIIFLFQSCVSKNEKEILKNKLCSVEISKDQLNNDDELTISISNSKNCDSSRIYFPHGGSVTFVSLFEDSLLKNKIASTPSF